MTKCEQSVVELLEVIETWKTLKAQVSRTHMKVINNLLVNDMLTSKGKEYLKKVLPTLEKL